MSLHPKAWGLLQTYVLPHLVPSLNSNPSLNHPYSLLSTTHIQAPGTPSLGDDVPLNFGLRLRGAVVLRTYCLCSLVCPFFSRCQAGAGPHHQHTRPKDYGSVRKAGRISTKDRSVPVVAKWLATSGANVRSVERLWEGHPHEARMSSHSARHPFSFPL